MKIRMKEYLAYGAEVLVLLSILLSVLTLPLGAQEMDGKDAMEAKDNIQYYQGSVHDLGWLEGTWEGSGLGGECKEVWEKSYGDTMMGMFKLTKDGKPAFYEFFVLLEKEEHIELRLKHFNPCFKGWERKEEFVTFKLISVDGHKAVFEGLTFEKVGENELQVFVDIKHDDGNVTKELFKFEKQI